MSAIPIAVGATARIVLFTHRSAAVRSLLAFAADYAVSHPSAAVLEILAAAESHAVPAPTLVDCRDAFAVLVEIRERLGCADREALDAIAADQAPPPAASNEGMA